MNEGLFRAVGAMRAAERRIDITAHNLANLSTHGYKRKHAAQREFQLLTDYGEARSIGSAAVTDHSQGPVDQTGYPTHLALRGPGFFAVEGPAGELYTRNGEFEFNRDGELVSADGFPVIWEERLGTFNDVGPDVIVEPDGEVHQGQTRLGRLRFVDFEDYGPLRELGLGYWDAPPTAALTNTGATISQGELEMSNATGIDEMVELITNQRAYELASRAVQQIDESYQRLNRPT